MNRQYPFGLIATITVVLIAPLPSGAADLVDSQAIESFETVESTVADEVNDTTVVDVEIPGPSARSDSREPVMNNLPTVGYVPGHDPGATRFDLIAVGPPPGDEKYLDAMAAEKDGRSEEALKLIAETLEFDPEHPRAKLAEGRLLVKTGQYERAVAVLSAITEARTDDWRPWFWLGSAKLLRGNLYGAESALDEALGRDGSVAEIWVQRALVAQEQQDWRTALQLLSVAAELAPEHPMVMLNIGITSEALGNIKSARAAYRKFLTGGNRVSNLVRFTVINHLSDAQVSGPAAAPPPAPEPLSETTVADGG